MRGYRVCGAGPLQRSAFPPPSLERRQKETHSLIIQSICFYLLDIVENSKWGFSPNQLYCSLSPLWLCKKLSSLLIFPRLWPKKWIENCSVREVRKTEECFTSFSWIYFLSIPFTLEQTIRGFWEAFYEGQCYWRCRWLPVFDVWSARLTFPPAAGSLFSVRLFLNTSSRNAAPPWASHFLALPRLSENHSPLSGTLAPWLALCGSPLLEGKVHKGRGVGAILSATACRMNA